MDDCGDNAKINVDHVNFKQMNVQVHLRGQYFEMHTVSHLVQSLFNFLEHLYCCAAGPRTCLRKRIGCFCFKVPLTHSAEVDFE